MATLISSATGNFTAAGTWKVASAVANAHVDNDSNSFNLSTGNSDSTAFVLAATAVDAVAIKIGVTVTPTGTLTVILRNSTAATDVATVTINASDLATPPTTIGLGWHVFSFAQHTPNGTDSYLIRVTRSVADGASNRIPLIASTAAAANMCRCTRLITTAAPAAGDKPIIAGEFLSAGSSTSYTVTMDNTNTTIFGAGPSTNGGSVNNKATFAFGTSSGTSYSLYMWGLFIVYNGGTMTMGTVATPMPSTSTAIFQFGNSVGGGTNVDSGIRIFGTFTAQGASKATVKTLLNTDEAAAQTALGVVSTSGWNNSDEICIASTTQTFSQSEKRTISTVDSATQVTVSAGLTNAHSAL